MVSRRTKAVTQLGIAVLTALWMVPMRRLLHSDGDESHKPTPLSPGRLAVSGAWGVGQAWAYNHGCQKVQSNRRRGLVVSLVGLTVEHRLPPRTESLMYSLGFGRVPGVAIYQAWYGLLRPLPGGD